MDRRKQLNRFSRLLRTGTNEEILEAIQHIESPIADESLKMFSEEFQRNIDKRRQQNKVMA